MERRRPASILVGIVPILGVVVGIWAWLADPGANPASSTGPRGSLAPSEEAGPPEPPGEIGMRSLLRELVDLEALARLPEPPYAARFVSSYDRRTVSPDAPDGWFANEDWASLARPNFLRTEEHAGRREYVLLDAQGPGAIVRLWSAAPAGTLRFYLDGEATPELETRFEELTTGKGPIPGPFAYIAARGYDLYFPIPFQKGCKITVDDLIARDPFQGGPLEKLYYQINYRSYSAETAARVRTFRRAEVAPALRATGRVAHVFAEPWAAYDASPSAVPVRLVTTGTELRASLERPRGGTIRELALIVRDTSDTALRRATISLSFDGETTVEAPLGDFFGSGPGLTAYDSLPFTVRDDGAFVCRFAMPFRSLASVVVRGSPGIEGALMVEPAPWTERSLHFHARFRPPAQADTWPPRDLGMISIEGRGVYVGDVFQIQNPSERWWGEGDEKIYLNGEKLPSFIGTGTEDYYGYAWSTGETFFRALHAQTRAGGPGFSGSFSLNRFRTLDAIPFETAFRFDLELWHWETTRVTWSALAYYYARPGATDDVPRLPSREP